MPSNTQTIPPGITLSICSAIHALTVPGEILPRLIHGDPKVLVTTWYEEDDDDIYNPSRGDGTTHLALPGDAFYRIPAEDHNPEYTNIRQGVPFWLVQMTSRGLFTRAYGLIHPVYNMAVVDYYDRHGNFGARRTVMDSRLSVGECRDLRKRLSEIYCELADMDAWRSSYMAKAPHFNSDFNGNADQPLSTALVAGAHFDKGSQRPEQP